MGIFTRFKDIVSANLNSMLDKAEDPEKMIRLMIREMEETLVELKAACAGSMAEAKKVERERPAVAERLELWTRRAELAVDQGEEELAREALREKRRYAERDAALDAESLRLTALVEQAREDIGQLEDKLTAAKAKQRSLAQRAIRAQVKRRAQEDIRQADSARAMERFERLEQNIERMEAEADLVNGLRPSDGGAETDKRFADLERDEDLERELEELKRQRGQG